MTHNKMYSGNKCFTALCFVYSSRCWSLQVLFCSKILSWKRRLVILVFSTFLSVIGSSYNEAWLQTCSYYRQKKPGMYPISVSLNFQNTSSEVSGVMPTSWPILVSWFQNQNVQNYLDESETSPCKTVTKFYQQT